MDDDGFETEEKKMKDFLNLHDAIESEKNKNPVSKQRNSRELKCVFIGKLSGLCMLMLVDTRLLGNRRAFPLCCWQLAGLEVIKSSFPC